MADEQETPAPEPTVPAPDPAPIVPEQRPYEFPDLDWNRRDLGDVPERKNQRRVKIKTVMASAESCKNTSIVTSWLTFRQTFLCCNW